MVVTCVVMVPLAVNRRREVLMLKDKSEIFSERGKGGSVIYGTLSRTMAYIKQLNWMVSVDLLQ